MASTIEELLAALEGEGFGLGGFGGTDEPFGTLGVSTSGTLIPVIEPFTIIPGPRKAPSIGDKTNSVYDTQSGLVYLSRTSNVDSAGPYLKPLRKLIFEQVFRTFNEQLYFSASLLSAGSETEIIIADPFTISASLTVESYASLTYQEQLSYLGSLATAGSGERAWIGGNLLFSGNLETSALLIDRYVPETLYVSGGMETSSPVVDKIYLESVASQGTLQTAASSSVELPLPAVFQVTSSIDTTPATAHTHSLGTTANADDLIIMFYTNAEYFNPKPASVTGWTEIVYANGSFSPRVHAYYKIASGGETEVIIPSWTNSTGTKYVTSAVVALSGASILNQGWSGTSSVLSKTQSVPLVSGSYTVILQAMDQNTGGADIVNPTVGGSDAGYTGSLNDGEAVSETNKETALWYKLQDTTTSQSTVFDNTTGTFDITLVYFTVG